MLHKTPFIRFRTTAGIGLIAGLAFLAGCAQPDRPASYYATQKDTTMADAQQQAQGRRGARAPSQVQIGFGDTDTEEAQSAPRTVNTATDDTAVAPSTPRALREAKTFLGTVPCISEQAGCAASRITLTLAPSGEWRSRTILLDTSGSEQSFAQQGCWDVIGANPLRIVLQTPGQESTASFTFVNDNVLRVNLYNDTRPVLDYHLTRQADIDPIDEFTDQTALNCGPSQS